MDLATGVAPFRRRTGWRAHRDGPSSTDFGMEAAAESGERAVTEIITRAG